MCVIGIYYFREKFLYFKCTNIIRDECFWILTRPSMEFSYPYYYECLISILGLIIINSICFNKMKFVIIFI